MKNSVPPEQIVVLGALLALAGAVLRFIQGIIPHLDTGLLGQIVEGIKAFMEVML